MIEGVEGEKRKKTEKVKSNREVTLVAAVRGSGDMATRTQERGLLGVQRWHSVILAALKDSCVQGQTAVTK